MKITFAKVAETPLKLERLKPYLEKACDQRVIGFFPSDEARCSLERDCLQSPHLPFHCLRYIDGNCEKKEGGREREKRDGE